MWNLEKRQQEAVFEDYFPTKHYDVFGDNNEFVVTRSFGKNIVVWNLKEKREEVVFKSKSVIIMVKITKNNEYVISGLKIKL